MTRSPSRLLRLASASALVLGVTLLPALPAAAHPEECTVTDDAVLDAQCEEHGKEGDESGETVLLDPDEQVLGRGPEGVFTTSKNMHALGFSERSVPLSGPGSSSYNSDLAFSGTTVVQGTYVGFRLVDVADPEAPREISEFADCVTATGGAGSQGDIVVADDLLVRTWDAPAPAGGGRCGDVPVPAGQEGVHVFDLSDPTAPDPVAFVRTPCGSHTATGVPDPANDRLLVYSSPSNSSPACRGIDVLEVPLDDPAAASYLRFVRSGEPGPAFPNLVTVGGTTYGATGANFGPAPSAAGYDGPVVVAAAIQACDPFAEPVEPGAVVVVERGACSFAVKVKNAQDAGAGAVIVANNAPGAPITMGGADSTIAIPAVMVSQADGTAIQAALPASGSISAAPQPATPDRACHDTGVILGSALKAGCAGGNGLTMFSMDPADGGSLEQPVVQYSKVFPGVTIGHSAAFTWDGEVVVFGHEPGGGGQPQCQATSPEVDRTLYFVDADSGETVGTFLHPRPQTATENCTWHNFNVVPTDKRYVLVSGNYQSGTSVVDFTDPSSAREVAFADPAPLSDDKLVVGGDWSTYWYDGRIYESDIRRGLVVWNLSDPAVAGARKLGHLNPQTQETTFDMKITGAGNGKGARR